MKPASKTKGLQGHRVITATALVLTMLVTACGWWNSGGSQVVANQGAQEVACVLAQVQSGNLDPIAIGVACTGGLLASLVSDFESILAYYTMPAVPADAGPPPSADGGSPKAIGATALCGAPGAKPPYPGAPSCLNMTVIATMREMHAQSKAALAAGAK